MYKSNLRHGTFIKLFNYRLRPLGIKKGMLNTRLQFVLASLMPDLGLPVRMYERRNNFQNSKDSNLLGLSTRLKEDRYKKLDEEAIFGSIIVDEISIPYKVYVFKRDTAVGNYKNDQFVIFTLNGQNQGELNQAVLTGKMFSKISYLKQHLLIMVDFSNVPAEYREEIFMVSRDRIKKDTDFYQGFEQRFYKQIAENDTLRRLASRRRAEDIKQRAKKDAIRKSPIAGEKASSEIYSNCSEIDGELECERNQFAIFSLNGIISGWNETNSNRDGKDGDIYFCEIEGKGKVQPIITNSDPSFHFTVELNREIFRAGEEMEIKINTTKEMFIYIFLWEL